MDNSVYDNLAKKRILFLNEDIDAQNATKLSAHFLYLNSLSKRKEITLYINCIGGVVDGGLFAIYDTMQQISCPIKTICVGQAYSSAAVILASGTPGRRLAFPNSTIMIHSVSLDNISGSIHEIEIETKNLQNLNDKMLKILSKHTKNKFSKIKQDCSRDKYMNAEEALQYGLIDGILTPEKILPSMFT